MNTFIKTILPIFILISINTYSQTKYVNIWQNTQLTIKDGDYYKRLDQIAQQQYDLKLGYINKAYEYLDAEDFESAIFWAEKITGADLDYEGMFCERQFLVGLSYANLKDKRYKTKYNYVANHCEPIKKRALESLFDELELPYKKR